MSIVEKWQRLEEWLGANADEVLETLRPGAAEDKIVAAEESLGVRFPSGFRESLGVHDGQIDILHTPDKYAYGLFEDGWALLSLEAITDTWRLMSQLRGSGDFIGRQSELSDIVVSDWWHPMWIPITGNGSGDNHCLDLNPGPTGTAGQIITFWHNWKKRQRVARSFEDWLNTLVAGLEQGEIIFSRATGFERAG